MNMLIADDFDGMVASITCPMQMAHLHKVLRASVGSAIKVGVLNTGIGVGTIINLTRSEAHIQLPALAPPPPKLDLALILAAPRPLVLRRVLMDITAFGVGDIYLIGTRLGEKSYWGSDVYANIDNYLKEGLRQGVDCVLPSVHIMPRFADFADALPALAHDKQGCVLHPYHCAPFDKNTPPKILAIGAERGFCDDEVQVFAEAGFWVQSLGVRILRTEAVVGAVLGAYFL